jgi:hypothetical protein
MKKFFLLILFLLLALPLKAAEFDMVQIDIRDYDGIEVPAGTFIPVMNAQEISTQYCEEGYKVMFTGTNDLYMHETNIIPKNTVFTGYIEKLYEPVVGTNAGMRIKITQMTLPDGFEIPLRGYIYSPNANVVGGGLSEPASYYKMPHYQRRFRVLTLRVAPSMERKMGTHTTMRSGSDEIIILTGPAMITHTLTY